MDMKNLKLATSVEYEFYDGTKARCSAAIYLVMQLASRNKKLANQMIHVINNGTSDIFEGIDFLYGAYVCANMDEEELLPLEEFRMMCGADYAGIFQTVSALIDPKNKMASANRSSEK